MTPVCLENIEALEKQTVVCLGFFDGVHLGHRRLIERACEIGREKGLDVCVHTFDAMPSQVVNPAADVMELTPLAEKAALLAALGVDVIAVSRFDETMMRMHAQEFFQRILRDKLRARHIVAGFHHRFGFQGEADARVLGDFCRDKNIGLDVIRPVLLADGELVSSTAIRRLLRLGDRAKAGEMLGRPG